MPRLVVRDFGPIKFVDFLLKPITVFIGPQSSGKSTLAKIISFCSWLEKDIVCRQSASHIDMDFIKEQLLEFHKMSNYIKSHSYISYTSDLIEFSCDFNTVSISTTSGLRDAKNGKIAYIPSERNVINLPGIQSLPLKRNNIRSFIFEWFRSHSVYNKENGVDLIGLNAKYFYDDSLKLDVIEMEDGSVIPMEDVSSGLQSLAPLYVYLKYVTEWVFNNEMDISFEKREILERSIALRYANLVLNESHNVSVEDYAEIAEKEYFKKIISDFYTNIQEIKSRSDIGNAEDAKVLKPYIDIDDSLMKPHYAKIIIEEPEQNLYTETQSKLVRGIFKLVNQDRDSLVITTHSPYVLSTLNNLIYAHNVGQNHYDEVNSIISSDVWVDYAKVCAYHIKDGILHSMMDDELRQLKAEMIDGVSTDLNLEYDRIFDIEG